jgi:hypothetical protein
MEGSSWVSGSSDRELHAFRFEAQHAISLSVGLQTPLSRKVEEGDSRLSRIATLSENELTAAFATG